VQPLPTVNCLAHSKGTTEYFALDAKAQTDRLQSFYHQALFGASLPATPLFDTATLDLKVTDERVRGYAAVTGGARFGDTMPLNMGFSLAWEPIFRVLSAPELAGGILRLVHLSNRFEAGAAWPLVAGDEVTVSAQVTRVENETRGRTIHTLSRINRDGVEALEVESAFFVRDAFGDEPYALQSREELSATLLVSDEAEARWLEDHGWLHPVKDARIEAGDTLIAEVQPAGMHQVLWDSRDDSRRPVAAGVYFYRLQVRDAAGQISQQDGARFSQVRKLLLLK